jgi:hypothetical protein
MNILWQLKEPVDSQRWNRKISHLMTELETTGCEFGFPSRVEEEETLSVYFPGLDTFLLAGLNSTSSSAAEQWVRSARTALWDRAEFKLNRQSQSIECRWIYWSPLQTFLHTAITCLFLLKSLSLSGASAGDLGILLLGCAIINLLAVFLSRIEESRLKAVFLASGFIR